MGGGGIGTSPYLRLDVNGRRFMNEDVPGQQVQNAAESIPDRRFFTIFDSKWVEQIGKGFFAPQHGSCNYVVGTSEWAVIPEMPKNLSTMSTTGLVSETAVEDAVAASAGGEGGDMMGSATYKGETIDELLAQFEGIDVTRAKASIERYNELCAKGVDEDYGKPAKRMLAVENPPYYGFESGMSSMLVCPGGLCSNERGEILDESGQHIEGLYACGNAQGSRYAVAYPIALRGVSHSLCMTYGYIVGKEAANAGSGTDLPLVVA
jgi:hypothetical protein